MEPVPLSTSYLWLLSDMGQSRRHLLAQVSPSRWVWQEGKRSPPGPPPSMLEMPIIPSEDGLASPHI